MKIDNMADIGIKLEVAPLRTLDDFLLDSARFQIPAFQDLAKWNNRVIQNLLYYQTNYFFSYIIIFVLVSIIHPTQMFFGMIALTLGFGIFFYVTSSRQAATNFKKAHPIISVLLVLVGCYYIVYLAGTVITFIFGILLPVSIIFIHASIRLRNLKNKILNKMEWLGLKRSPMGVILDYLDIEMDFLM